MPRGIPNKKREMINEESITTDDIRAVSKATQEENQTEQATAVLSTGIDLFDLALGGGFGLHKIINIVGDNSSGKTLIAMEFIAYCRNKFGKKFKWFYDDAEAGFSFNSEQLYGFKLIEEDQKCSYTVEEFNYNLQRKIEAIKKDETFVYVLDSLDALSSKAEVNRDAERSKKIDSAIEDGDDLKDLEFAGSYGMERQKMLSEMLRLRMADLAGKNCALIIISQVRMNIGVMFGEKYTRTGGKALDFYASQIAWLAVASKQFKKNRATGVTIKAKLKKNKIGKPFRECFIDAIFDYGIDNIASNAKFLFDLITPTGEAKKSIKINFDEKDFKSLEEFIEHIEANKLQKDLRQLVIEKWNKIEESISSKDRIPKFSNEEDR